MQTEESKTITVLGLGNLLCGDDGFGVHAVEKLYSQFDFPEHVNLIDGGSQGPILQSFVEESDRLLIFDAMDFGLAAGTLSIFAKANLPIWLGMHKLSPHQNSFSETLALASLRNLLPTEICLIGFQVSNVEFGSEISPMARVKIPEAINMALQILKSWGVETREALYEKHLLNYEMQKKVY